MKLFSPSLLLGAFSTSIQLTSAQQGCCSAWWFAPPNATMTRLQSTMIIPPLSKGPGVHFVWPGLEPRPGSFVFQNVIGDQQQPGNWSFATWYGPQSDGSYHEYGQVIVHEGDSLISDFALDLETGSWIDNWILLPRQGKGEKSSSGAVQVSFEGTGALTDTIFEIELQDGAVWDFGKQIWESIVMEVNSTETGWCTEPSLGQYGFNYSMTDPVAMKNEDGTSSCYIARLVFENP